MSEETGGPAFPTESYDADRGYMVREEGMTLRDKFADSAMKGMLAGKMNVSLEGLAKSAYTIADAMLKERVK